MPYIPGQYVSNQKKTIKIATRSLFAAGVLGFIVTSMLVLVGCMSTSPGISDIRLVTMSFPNQNTTKVGVGSFGLCVATTARTECVTTAHLKNDQSDKILSTLRDNKGLTISTSTENLIKAAFKLQRQIWIPAMALSAGLFLTSLLPWFYVNERKGLPSGKGPQMVFYALWGASFAAGLASATSTTMNLDVLDYMTTQFKGVKTEVTIQTEDSVEGLQWAVIACSVLTIIGAAARSATINMDDIDKQRLLEEKEMELENAQYKLDPYAGQGGGMPMRM